MSVKEITIESESERAATEGSEPFGGHVVRAERELLELPGYDGLKTCRRCGGICNREHVHVEDCRWKLQCITHVYCDHCGMAWESLMIVVAMRWEHYHTMVHSGKKLGAYLLRLGGMICVAA